MAGHCLTCFEVISTSDHSTTPISVAGNILCQIFPEFEPQLFQACQPHGDHPLMVCGQCSEVVQEVKYTLKLLEELQAKIQNFKVRIKDDLEGAYKKSQKPTSTSESPGGFALRQTLFKRLNQQNSPEEAYHPLPNVRVKVEVAEGGFGGGWRSPSPPELSPIGHFEPEEPEDPLEDDYFEKYGLKPLQITLERCDSMLTSRNRRQLEPQTALVQMAKQEISNQIDPNSLPPIQDRIRIEEKDVEATLTQIPIIDGTMTCTFCDRVTAGREMRCGMRRHLRNFHGPRKNKDALTEVVNRITLTDGKLVCPFCEKFYKNRDQIRRHLRTFHFDQPEKINELEFIQIQPAQEPLLNIQEIKKIMKNFSLKKKLLTCPVCQKIYSGRDVIKRHLVHLHGPIRARALANLEKTPKVIVKHLPIVNGTMNCPVCQKTFGGEFVRDTLRRHLRGVHGPKMPRENPIGDIMRTIPLINDSLTCPICSKSYTTKAKNDVLRRHLRKVHFIGIPKPMPKEDPLGDLMKKIPVINNTMTCPICSKYYSTPSYRDILRKHLQNVHFIGKTPPESKEQIRSRKTTSLGEFPCPICGAFYSRKSYMEKHMSIHETKTDENTMVRTFSINDGPSSSTSASNQVHEFLCNSCPSSFITLANLDVHKKRMHGVGDEEDKTYLCEQCPDTFKSQSILNTHKRIKHDRMYACPKCDKVLSMKRYLEGHLYKFHGIGKPLLYQCDKCLYQTNHRANFDSHVARHGDGPKFICKQCGSVFKRKSSLKTHFQGVHSEKSFTCTFCDLKFSMARELRNHIAVKHQAGGDMISCKYCSMTFPIKRYMRNHVRRHHKEEEAARIQLIAAGAPMELID